MINKNSQDNKELTKDNIKEKIEELISDIDKELKAASEDYVKIIVYVNKGKNEIIAKFNIESDGSKMKLNIKENVNYDENDYTINDEEDNL